MKNSAILITFIYILFSSSSCSNNNAEEKQNRDIALIQQFFKTLNEKNILEASKLLPSNTLFSSYVLYDQKRDGDNFDYFFTLENTESHEDSYVQTLNGLYQYYNRSDEDKMNIRIDSIIPDTNFYRVFQSIGSNVCKELELELPTKIEDFYIQSDSIKKIVLQSIIIPEKTTETKQVLSYWIYKMTGKDIMDFHTFWLNTAPSDSFDMLVNKYKGLKSFEQTLDKKYKLSYSLSDLYKESFMTSHYENVPVNLYLNYKSTEVYEDVFFLEKDLEPKELVHLIFANDNDLELNCITRVQDKSAFENLIPGQKCSVYGIGTKNATGEFRLKDVIVYNYDAKN